MKPRAEMNKTYMWSLDRVYESNERIQMDINYVTNEVEKLVQYENKVCENPTNLLVVVNLYHQIFRRLETIYVYHSHKLDQDHGDAKAQAANTKIKNLYVSVSSELSFIIPEIAKADSSVIMKWVESDEHLMAYHKFFEDVYFTKDYVLSNAEERIMSLSSMVNSSTYDVYSALTNADLKFESIEDRLGRELPMDENMWAKYSTDEDRRVRRSAFNSLLSAYGNLENTFASLYINHVKSLIFKTEARKYDNPRQMALHNNQIDEQIYDVLIDVVSDNVELNHRYLKLKQELLGLDELHMYDMYVPIIEGVDRDYDYAEAKKLVYLASEKLGEEYQAIMQQAFNEKWIDVYPNEGKRGGAYSGGSYDTKPFILLNYTKKINDVFTLAHELGHSAHSYLTNNNQTYQKSHYKIFVAEVASIVNELLLFDYMISREDTRRDEKLYLLNYFLDQFRATMYRQTMFAEFEAISKAKIFNNESVNTKILNRTYYELNEKYFGKEVKIDEQIMNEWMRIPHFYMNYYVYQYATSYAVALKVAKEIIEDNETMKENYLEFLKAGDSKAPLELIAMLGIDMHKRDIYEEAFVGFEAILSQIERAAKKRS